MGGMNLALRTVKTINYRINLVSRTVNPISGHVNLTCWTLKVIGCRNRVVKTTLKAVIHQPMSPTPQICAFQRRARGTDHNSQSRLTPLTS